MRRGQALEEPHVGDRGGQLDVAHALAAHARPGDLDAALVADDARELHALVLAARALVVLGRAEDAGAEQPVALRLEGPVVDGLRLLDFPVRPVANLLRRCELDTDRPEAHAASGDDPGCPTGPWQACPRVPGCRKAGPSAFYESPYDGFLPSFGMSSTSSARLCSSFTSTLKDSGVPGSRKFSPFTMAS